MRVLVAKGSFERAQDFAEKVGTAEVWSELAQGYLRHGDFNACVQCFLQANNPSFYLEVIELGRTQPSSERLVEYLQMARKSLRESAIDNVLVLCYS